MNPRTLPIAILSSQLDDFQKFMIISEPISRLNVVEDFLKRTSRKEDYE